MFGYKSKLKIARQAWNPKEMAAKYDDVRLKVLCYAILAPNPHNAQAWKIHLEKTNEILLYVDPDHLLPMTDPLHRQIYISQGTFLELLSIAAKEFGYKPSIQLFPEGIDPVKKTGKSPVARITIMKTEVKKDELFNQIPVRFTNRRPYKGPSLTAEELNSLKKSYDVENYPMRFITDDEKMRKIADLLTEAMKVETYLDRTHKETVGMVRFNDDEVIEYRDGFNYENMGVTGFIKFFAELFGGRDKAFGSFRRRTVDAHRKMAHTAKAIGLIFSKENSRIEHVEIGRRYVRVQLTATKLGLSMHPMMQVTQEYEELAETQEEFLDIIKPYEGVLQMVIRVGHAKPTPHSARRKLENFLF